MTDYGRCAKKDIGDPPLFWPPGTLVPEVSSLPNRKGTGSGVLGNGQGGQDGPHPPVIEVLDQGTDHGDKLRTRSRKLAEPDERLLISIKGERFKAPLCRPFAQGMKKRCARLLHARFRQGNGGEIPNHALPVLQERQKVDQLKSGRKSDPESGDTEVRVPIAQTATYEIEVERDVAGGGRPEEVFPETGRNTAPVEDAAQQVTRPKRADKIKDGTLLRERGDMTEAGEPAPDIPGRFCSFRRLTRGDCGGQTDRIGQGRRPEPFNKLCITEPVRVQFRPCRSLTGNARRVLLHRWHVKKAELAVIWMRHHVARGRESALE